MEALSSNLSNKQKVWELIKQSVPLDKTFGDASISENTAIFLLIKVTPFNRYEQPN